ncbi:MAG TPA: DUF134 domain-containing protein [Clostridia bacterium]|nr:DUF134 domain-containing protein [Clostridia bacterium]
MPRPKKWRRVCGLPENNRFGPIGGAEETQILTVDEYETIRLIDSLGMKQEECAEQMNVARTTVQGIYDNARKKIADAIVNGKNLVIEGGEYTLCQQNRANCGRGCGRRNRCGNHPAIDDEKLS